MQRTRVDRWLVASFLGLFLTGGLAFGQKAAEVVPSPKSEDKKVEPKKNADEQASLEELLAKALKSNPDIRVAETKLREAEAELNRAELQVMQKLVAFRHDLEASNKMVDEAQERLRTLLQLKSAHAVSAEEFRAGELTLLRFKAEKARLEAELPYLLGNQVGQRSLAVDLGFPVEGLVLSIDKNNLLAHFEIEQTSLARPKAVDKDMAARLHKALDTPVQVNFKDKSLKEILSDFERQAPEARFVVAPVEAIAGGRFSLHLEDKVPLAAALQAVGDLNPPVFRFAVRDYGILVTDSMRVPNGYVSVHEFCRSKPPEAK